MIPLRFANRDLATTASDVSLVTSYGFPALVLTYSSAVSFGPIVLSHGSLVALKFDNWIKILRPAFGACHALVHVYHASHRVNIAAPQLSLMVPQINYYLPSL